MPNIVIDPARCIRCNACVEECFEGVFTAGEEGAAPCAVRADLCVSCGHCVALCAQDAIRHPDFPPGSLRRVAKEILPGPEALMELFRARRSGRVFQNRPVPQELVEKVIEAARLAPTGHNCQGTQYIVVQSGAELRQIADRTATFLRWSAFLLRNPVIRGLYGLADRNGMKCAWDMVGSFETIAKAAKEGRDRVLRSAPCLLIFHADPALAYPDKSAQLAVQNASLMCDSLGLMSFYTGYFMGACDYRVPFSALAGMPKRHRVYAALAIGWSKVAFSQWPDRKPAPVQWR